MNNIITDTSYTNKDFQSIYPELLDLATKLSNKWDPSLSNESDPGVVLLKLNALIADKNNYNIDKNVLECFPQSVTQYGNARKLYDLLGYNMNHYISAVGNVTFQLKSDSSISNDSTVIIPQFTQLTDENNEISFVTLQTVTLEKSGITNLIGSKSGSSVSVDVMEGRIKKYLVNDQQNILLNNLDNNLRLYFDEPQIAQNGIFIQNVEQGNNDYETSYNTTISDDASTYWERVDNLAPYESGKKIYQFGVLPNSNICYIQFPKDISSLIGAGLNIMYVVSSGLDGNIKANTLTKFVNNIQVGTDNTVINDQIVIKQTKGTTNGADPESLSDAYNNFKKTIGTFDTLVTKKDFENFIYNLTQPISNNPYLSNIKVSDRTDDINYTNYIQTRNSLINLDKKLVVSKSNTDEKPIELYNIIPYMLNWTMVSNKSTYDDNFKYTTNKNIFSLINTKVSEIKSIPTEIRPLNPNNDFIYTNNYTLNGSVITYYKVTSAEKKEIEDNIKNALYVKYQPRNIEFGKELDYEDIINTIKSSDNRIKTVILDTPILNTASNTINKGTLTELVNDDKSKLIARMVLAGNVQLYSYLEDITFDFGQMAVTKDNSTSVKTIPHENNNPFIGVNNITNEKTITTIKSITTYANYTLSDENNKYELKLNEELYALKPSVVTTKEYISPVKYRISGFGVNGLECNKNIKLSDGQKIELQRKDENNLIITETLSKGDIIYFNSTSSTKSDNNNFIALNTSEYIDKNEESSIDLNYNSNIQYFCILSDKRFADGEDSFTLSSGDYIILTDNEYFIEKSTLSDEVILYQVGTKITNSTTGEKAKGIIIAKKTSIVLDEIDDIEGLDWKTLSQDESLNIQEMEVLILNEGTKVWSNLQSITFTDNAYKIGKSEAVNDYSTIFYITPDSTAIQTFESTLPNQAIYLRSALNINTTTIKPQLLRSNQTIKFKFINNEVLEFKGNGENRYFIFNYPVVLAGGDDIDASVFTDQKEYLLKAFVYDKEYNTSINDIPRDENGILNITSDTDSLGTTATSFNLNFNFGNGKLNSVDAEGNKLTISGEYYYIIPVEVKFVSSDQGLTFTRCNIKGLSTNKISKDGIYYIEVNYKNDKNVTPDEVLINITCTLDKSLEVGEYIKIGRITKLNGYNVSEIDSNNYKINDNKDEIIKEMKLIDTTNIFNWIYKVPDSDKVLKPADPSSFWNSNHIANKYILPRLTQLDINVNTNSLK